MKVTERFLVPAFRTVPLVGEYANVPGMFAVEFNCVEPRAVP